MENPERLAFLEYGALSAFMPSCRSTCPRRHVGCALFNKNRVVTSTGYNGAPSGAPQCNEVGCLIIDGHCRRITHAEKNARLFAGNRDLSEGYSFVTIRPCKECFYLFVEAKLRYIYYLEDYRAEELAEEQSKVCKEKGIVMELLNFDLAKLLQKAIDFHQGPGGLLVGHNRLTIEEHIPEMMDH